MRRLCSAPSRLCVAFGIDWSMNGVDLTGGDPHIAESEGSGSVEAAPRVGIDYAGAAKDWPWRFLRTGDPYVSRKP